MLDVAIAITRRAARATATVASVLAFIAHGLELARTVRNEPDLDPWEHA